MSIKFEIENSWLTAVLVLAGGWMGVKPDLRDCLVQSKNNVCKICLVLSHSSKSVQSENQKLTNEYMYLNVRSGICISNVI